MTRHLTDFNLSKIKLVGKMPIAQLNKIGTVLIRHTNPLLFDVIDDKPEDVARGDNHAYCINTSP